ncbi:GntR family transcriptional regulator [Variovorax defluvii]|uniref:GntR family transcriptional regulator n=1 Tax=Variovorax defluvii TaxID=913761 RepID=A0ABP8I8N3_9BURK
MEEVNLSVAAGGFERLAGHGRRAEDASFGRQQLSASVATHLREQIISGQLQPGAFLRIDTIARQLDVSTTPVREGLLLLQSESFVRLIPRRGFVVNSFTKGDLRDLFWAQATIAAKLAERATTRMSGADVERLGDIHARHEAAVAGGDNDAAARLGHQFHRTINLAAQAPRLALLLGSLTKQLPNRFYASIEGQLQDAVAYHPIIMNAIRVHDADAARSLMYRHIVSGAEHLITMLERQGVWAAADGREAEWAEGTEAAQADAGRA